MSMTKLLGVLSLAVSMTACLGGSKESADEPSPFVPPPENRAPVIGSLPAESTVVAGSAISLEPTASDPDNDPLTFEVSNKPVWSSFDTSTGRLWGTPAIDQVGTYSNIRISVRDSTHITSGNAFRIVVSAPAPDPPPPTNQPPVISGTPRTSVTTGQAYSFTPSASDPEGQSLLFSIAGMPAWASFSSGNGRLSGTPGNGTGGTYGNIRISVSDGTTTVSLPAFSITVIQANRSPTISGTPPTTGREGIGYSFTPTGSDPDGQAISYSIGGKPSWASFNTSTGRLSGTPPAGSAGSFPGIVITVSDGSLQSSLSAFTITVAANQAPTISGTPSTTVTVGQAYSFTPTASDPDGNSLAFTIANKPSWATFTASSGRLSGTPTAAAVGAHTAIRISVTDSMATTALPDFEIEVEAANQAPVISGTPATSVVAGQAYVFQPTASDPDGDTLSFTITNKPGWATFNQTTGHLSGTPAAGDVGEHANIQIRVSDGTLQAALSAFTITVQQTANGSAMLTWTAPTTRTDGSPLTNIAGYIVRYGNSAGNYPNTVTINNAGVTSFMVENLSSGTWFFVMSCFDANGLESANTNPVSKTIQ